MAKVSAAKIKTLFTTYIGIRQQRETFAKQEDEYKKQLSNVVETQGYTDDKGSLYVDFDAPIEGYAGLKRERRVNQLLNEDKALEILRRRGLAESCIRTIEVVNEDAVRAALYDGKLSQDDIDSMFIQKETYAFIPRKV
jgi:hypothetical protein